MSPRRGIDQVLNKGKIKLSIRETEEWSPLKGWNEAWMEQEKGEERMDRGAFCSRKRVSMRGGEREMGNKRLWGLLLWQAIHSSCSKDEQRLVNGRVKTGRRVWQVERWSAAVYCGIVHQVLYCNKLSIRCSDQRSVVQLLLRLCVQVYMKVL